MDEAEQFAEKLLADTEVIDDETIDVGTPTEDVEENIDEEQSQEEESQTSEETEDDKSLKNENPKLETKSKKETRAERRLRQLLSKGRQTEDYYSEDDVYNNGEITLDQLDDLISKKAEAIIEQREIQKYQEDLQEDWVSQVEDMIKKYPQLNPESKEYDKDIDDLISQAIVDAEGNPRFDINVDDMFNKIISLQQKAISIKKQENKQMLNTQADESALSSNINEPSKKAKLNIDDLDGSDLFEAIRKGLID